MERTGQVRKVTRGDNDLLNGGIPALHEDFSLGNRNPVGFEPETSALQLDQPAWPQSARRLFLATICRMLAGSILCWKAWRRTLGAGRWGGGTSKVSAPPLLDY
jgi:hypothetical protein